MAKKQNDVRIIEKNEGPKIAWKQEGTKLVFGEEEDITINCATREKDWPVHTDIFLDEDGNLSTGTGLYYVAQVDIPERKYIDVPDEDTEAPVEEAASAEESSETEKRVSTHKEALPIDMGDVVLTLWNVSGFPAPVTE